jgi:hypothetical protein
MLNCLRRLHPLGDNESDELAIGTALTGPSSGLDHLGDLADSLVTGLNRHLKHQEDQALPLIHAFATRQQWAHFGQVHGQRIGPD